MPERGSKMSKVSVVWATFGIFRHNPNHFPSQLTSDKTRLYHYDPETKQQSLEWWHSGSPHPKKFRVQKSAGKVLASILWDQDNNLSLIIFQSAKLSTKSITHLCWCNWRTFWRRKSWEGHQGVLFLDYNAPSHWALETQKILAYLGFQCLDHPPYSPDLAPLDYHLFPGLKKKTTERSPFFIRHRAQCCHGDLVGQTTLWIFFLSGLQNLKQWAKKYIELRGEYVE